MSTPDLYILREGEGIDYDALRAAFVVATDSPRLAELVKRDMRIEPFEEPRDSAAQAWLEGLAQIRRNIYEATKGVSMVIPLHNYAAYVTQALDSIMEQTRLPEEIIVVNDASADDSEAVVKRYIEQHEAFGLITLINNPKNLDLAETQNTGIRASTQEYIVCLDADDMIEPRYIEALHMAMLADRSLGVAYCGVKVLRNGELVEPPDFPAFDWEWMARPSDPPLTCIPKPSMFRRAMWARVGGFQQTYRAGEDVDFWLRGLSTGWNARKVTPERLFTYRVHSQQQMSRARKFTRVDHYKPWMRDKMFPFAAPTSEPVPLFDYTHPTVSIIIPCGPGHERYLPSALESVLGQSVRSWETIVVNDTGDPLSQEMLEPYPFARVVDGGRLGVAHARNAGIANAHAPLVCFLDADDWLQPFALQAMLRRYAQGDAGYVYGDWIPVGEEGMKNREEAGDYVHDLRHARGMYAGVTVLMATEHALQLHGFSDSSNGFEDWDFFIRCSINGICGTRVTYPTLAYRLYTGTRRAMSNQRRTEIEGIFQQRYGAFMRGESSMASCCGGNGGAIMAAKEALGMVAPEPTIPSGDRIPMEYIGPYAAGVMYFGKYFGGNNPADKFAHDGNGNGGVLRDDVEQMLNTGQWRIAEAPAHGSAAPEPRVTVAQKVEAAEAIEPIQEVTPALEREMEALGIVKDVPATEILAAMVAPDDEGRSKTRRSKRSA